jgi:hypothetical protein
MTTTINKSRLMQRAWNIYRGNNPYSGNFSISLRRAWEVEKENARYAEEQAQAEAERIATEIRRAELRANPNYEAECKAAYKRGANDYYLNYHRFGTYCGD